VLVRSCEALAQLVVVVVAVRVSWSHLRRMVMRTMSSAGAAPSDMLIIVYWELSFDRDMERVEMCLFTQALVMIDGVRTRLWMVGRQADENRTI
jgi:hypothetical protein